MNELQKKIVILLANLPVPNKNIYFLAAKLDCSVSNMHCQTKILENMGHISKIGRGKGSFYRVKPEVVENAKQELE